MSSSAALPVQPEELPALPVEKLKPVSEWISTNDLAELASISDRKARTAAVKCSSGGTWRGVRLEVRYEGRTLMIHAPSLPKDLRDIWHRRYQAGRIAQAIREIPQSAASAREAKLARRHLVQRWRLELIAPALQYRKHGKERGHIIKALAARAVTKPNGKPWKPTVSTLESWIKSFEKGSETALAPKAREENSTRVLVSRAWDRACPLELKQKLAECLTMHVKSLWAEGAPGWRRVNDLAAGKFLEDCRAAGWNGATLDQCRPGRAFVERYREFSVIAVQEKDHKRFFDQYLPRIQRQRNGYQPGDIVVGDVHPMDVVCEIDGRKVHPRLISWLDIATYDLFVTAVFPSPGCDVRQEHVAASFVDMVRAWGLPYHLRLDRGKEFKWEPMMEGFDALAGLVRAFKDFRFRLLDEGEIADYLDTEQFAAVSRARPYNAPAKQIEHVFALIEYQFFSMMPGWIGGDRMNKRTQLAGHDPKAYHGTEEEFRKDMEICLDLYRNTPQKDGSSPNDKRRQWIEKGHEAVGVPRESLIFAFSERKKLTVGQGRVQYLGRWYAADVLIPLAQRRLEFHVAKWAPEAIFHVDAEGKLHAIPLDKVFNQHDGEGAREQSRRWGILKRHVRERKAQTRPVNLLEETARYNAKLPPPPQTPFGAVITTTEGKAVAQALADMTRPAATELLPGQFLNPATGQIVELKPPDEEGSKPIPIGFDPLNFALPPTETQKPNPAEPEFDLFATLVAQYDEHKEDKP